MKLALKVYTYVIIFAIIVTGVILIRMRISFNDRMKNFKENSLSGKVKDYKSIGRDYYEFILTEGGRDQIVVFPYFGRYMKDIGVNDSIYKPSYSMMMSIYKINSQGEYKFHREVQIYYSPND